MKRLAILPIFGLLLLFSCTKGVDTFQPPNDENSFQSRVITRNLDSTELTLTIRPAVSCLDAAGPCNLYVDMVATLSKPIADAVRIEIEKQTVAGVQDSTSENVIPETELAIILNIMPYQTRLAFRTGAIYNESPETIRDKYTLKSVVVYKPME